MSFTIVRPLCVTLALVLLGTPPSFAQSSSALAAQTDPNVQNAVPASSAPFAAATAVSDPPEQVELPTPPFWTARRVAIVSGIAGAIGAAAISWSSEMRLRERKRDMEALPPGAVDQFNQAFADATAVKNTRDFWRNVSLGVGGVTLGYWAVSAVSSRSGRLKPLAGKPDDRGWRIRVNPFHPEISISRSLP